MTIIPNTSTVSSFKVRGQVPGGINSVGTSRVDYALVLYEHMCSMTDHFFVLLKWLVEKYLPYIMLSLEGCLGGIDICVLSGWNLYGVDDSGVFL